MSFRSEREPSFRTTSQFPTTDWTDPLDLDTPAIKIFKDLALLLVTPEDTAASLTLHAPQAKLKLWNQRVEGYTESTAQDNTKKKRSQYLAVRMFSGNFFG